MKIGVIGTGRIGSSIGEKWIAAGHDVMYGLRDLGKATELAGKNGTIAEAIAHGDVILFAIPGRAMAETVEKLELAGKIIIDATNGGDTSDKPLVQLLAEKLPNSTVYKAFNTLGFENFITPEFGEKRADLLFIGSEDSKETVEKLISDVGLNPQYVGDLERMNVLDASMRFWFALTQHFGRHVAFNILTDPKSSE